LRFSTESHGEEGVILTIRESGSNLLSIQSLKFKTIRTLRKETYNFIADSQRFVLGHGLGAVTAEVLDHSRLDHLISAGHSEIASFGFQIAKKHVKVRLRGKDFGLDVSWSIMDLMHVLTQLLNSSELFIALKLVIITKENRKTNPRNATRESLGREHVANSVLLDHPTVMVVNGPLEMKFAAGTVTSIRIRLVEGHLLSTVVGGIECIVSSHLGDHHGTIAMMLHLILLTVVHLNKLRVVCEVLHRDLRVVVAVIMLHIDLGITAAVLVLKNVKSMKHIKGSYIAFGLLLQLRHVLILSRLEILHRTSAMLLIQLGCF
jgi:hypothetical protein